MSEDFMCPVCKSAPLITDYCPSCSRIESRTAPPDAFPQAHRLALELECLLLSCTDTAATAKWWDSAHEALEQWRQFCTIEPAPQENLERASEGHRLAAMNSADAPAGAAPLPDAQLCRFYDVDNFPDLVAAMDHHIEKLQAKLPPTPSLKPTRVREG